MMDFRPNASAHRRFLVLVLAVAMLGLLVLTFGCGKTSTTTSASTSTTSASAVASTSTAASPVSSTPTSSSSVTTSTGSPPPPSSQPSAGPVPAGFTAASVTFVSAQEAFVLGTAPGSGTHLLHTLDRGHTWVALTAPTAPLGRPGAGGGNTVWGTRFASPSHGFVFGIGLWETIDGGKHWISASAPTGSILSLAIIDGQVLALAAKAGPGGGLGPATLFRRPLAGGSWSSVASVGQVDLLDPTDLIATQRKTAALLAGTSVLVTNDGGITLTHHATPSTSPGFTPASVTVNATGGLALLCVGQGYTGHTDKQVYTSADGGAHWTMAGKPSSEGDGGTLAASAGNVVLVTASAASWIDRSHNGGQTWATVKTYGDGGVGWADLGFTTPSNAVVVHGPAATPGATDSRPGELLLSVDGGATWQSVVF
jgi:hypothetical protein